MANICICLLSNHQESGVTGTGFRPPDIPSFMLFGVAGAVVAAAAAVVALVCRFLLANKPSACPGRPSIDSSLTVTDFGLSGDGGDFRLVLGDLLLDDLLLLLLDFPLLLPLAVSDIWLAVNDVLINSPSCHITGWRSSKNCCWGPMTHPGRQILIHAMTSGAVSR